MSGNSFGTLFKITTFGESHGKGIGCIIDGCPSLLDISEHDIQQELNKRKPGQNNITTPRAEEDTVEILSGVFNGKTTGAPICLMVYNKDHKSSDYDNLKDAFRPGHADFTYQMKYGIRDHRGGGRSSARETIARVAAGAIAKKFLTEKLNIDIIGFTNQIGDIKINDLIIDNDNIESLKNNIANNITRCPDSSLDAQMIALINSIREQGNSIGGVVRCIVKNCPIGLGEPVFNKLPALLGYAMMSINATKGFEIGEGFNVVNLDGYNNNDQFSISDDNRVITETNHSGGVLGGISNGQDIDFKVFFKPTSTIKKKQNTIDINLQKIQLEIMEGRHDPCVVPRAVSIVEAMAALVLMDLFLINRGIYER